MSKKIIAFLVGLLLLLTLAVGCTGKVSTESKTNEQEQTLTEKQTTDVELKEVSVNIFDLKS